MALLDRREILERAWAVAEKLREREASETSLFQFLTESWRYIDPAPFIGGWHLEAIAEHLEAVTDGDIKRLCINVPPRTSKSSLCSVAWQAWTWAQSDIGPLSGPQVQFLTSSYAQSLSLRDSVKTRRLIDSKWYQENWGNRFALTSDVNTKSRFENTAGGYRLATSVDGALTGEGGDIILLDDPHLATEVESDLVRESTLQWWDESMSTRLNNQQTGAYVIVMQRLHQEDLTGHVMTREVDDWTWLMLPMRHDTERHCITYVKGQKFWEDPRKDEGELLCPDRFGPVQVDNLERRLGPYAFAGQMQQSPEPRGGGIIKAEWWNRWTDKLLPRCDYVLASLDTAYTEKQENDASALTIWGVFRHSTENVMPAPRKGHVIQPYEAEDWHKKQLPKVCLLYAWQDRLSFPDLVAKVVDSCTIDPKNTSIKHRFKVDKLVIEAKAAGISAAQELHKQIGFNPNLSVDLFNPNQFGDKIARVYAVQSIFSEGFVYIPWPTDEQGNESVMPYKWVEEVVDQVSVFPRGAHDDFVDSMSMGLRYLREMGMLSRAGEHALDLEAEMQYRPKLEPLYPV